MTERILKDNDTIKTLTRSNQPGKMYGTARTEKLKKLQDLGSVAKPEIFPHNL